MRYSVDELDAMPSGTCLLTLGGPTGQAAMNPCVIKSWTGWFSIAAVDSPAPMHELTEMDFTHRADPTPIPQPAPAQPCDGEVQR